jgi:hypothetical protein
MIPERHCGDCDAVVPEGVLVHTCTAGSKAATLDALQTTTQELTQALNTAVEALKPFLSEYNWQGSKFVAPSRVFVEAREALTQLLPLLENK